MKRLLLILACLVAALVVAPAARAGIDINADYQGRLGQSLQGAQDPNTWFGFDVDKVNGHKRVRHLAFKVPITCRKSGEQGYLPAEVRGSFRIRHSRFHGTGDLQTMGTGGATVTGRLRRSNEQPARALARGTLAVNYVDGDRTDSCYSGILRWRAHRGAPVPFPSSAVVPALALAGAFPENQYEGRIEADPHTYFGFDVVRRNGDRKVIRIFTDAPYFCHDGSHGYLMVKMLFPLGVHDGIFENGITGPGLEGPPTHFTVRGRLHRHGKASGRVKWTGEMSGSRCYTPFLDWRAKRGAEVVPEPPPGGP